MDIWLNYFRCHLSDTKVPLRAASGKGFSMVWPRCQTAVYLELTFFCFRNQEYSQDAGDFSLIDSIGSFPLPLTRAICSRHNPSTWTPWRQAGAEVGVGVGVGVGGIILALMRGPRAGRAVVGQHLPAGQLVPYFCWICFWDARLSLAVGDFIGQWAAELVVLWSIQKPCPGNIYKGHKSRAHIIPPSLLINSTLLKSCVQLLHEIFKGLSYFDAAFRQWTSFQPHLQHSRLHKATHLLANQRYYNTLSQIGRHTVHASTVMRSGILSSQSLKAFILMRTRHGKRFSECWKMVNIQ